MESEKNDRGQVSADGDRRGRVDEQKTKPAEEWGERLEAGKRIARGGKEGGKVAGAEPEERPSQDAGK